MEQFYLIGARIDDLLLRIEQILDKRLATLTQLNSDDSEFVTRKDAAVLLKISLPTLHEWTKQGWIVAYKVGNRVLYKKSELEKSITSLQNMKFKKGGMV